MPKIRILPEDFQIRGDEKLVASDSNGRSVNILVERLTSHIATEGLDLSVEIIPNSEGYSIQFFNTGPLPDQTVTSLGDPVQIDDALEADVTTNDDNITIQLQRKSANGTLQNIGDRIIIPFPEVQLGTPTTQTGLPGTEAQVTIDPTSPDTAKVFQFLIPRGDKGEAGTDGKQGQQGIQGAYYVKIFRRYGGDLSGTQVEGDVSWTPTSFNGGAAGWSLTVPGGTDHVFESELLYNPDGQVIGDWSLIFQAGAQGPTGPPGKNGTDGTNGEDGTNGTNGVDGATIYFGTGLPSTPSQVPADAIPGDYYIQNTSTGVFLWGPKGAGTSVQGWGTSGVSLTGLQGTPGTDGTDGAKGDQGESLSTNVSYDDAITGDTYNGQVAVEGDTVVRFHLTSGDVLDPILLHRGAKGDDGEKGDPGIQGDPGEGIRVGGSSQDGAGDTTVVLEGITSGADLGSFLVRRGLKGDPGMDGTNGMDGAPGTHGADGTNGIDGTSIHTGPADPAIPGKEGDWYINTGTGFLWEYTGGTWVETDESLEGEKGEDGTITIDGVAYTNITFSNAGNVDFTNTNGVITANTLGGGTAGINTVTEINDGDDTAVPTEGAVFRYAPALGATSTQRITQDPSTRLEVRGSFDLLDNDGDKSFDFSGTSGDIHLENQNAADENTVKVLFDKSEGALYYERGNLTGPLSTADRNEVATIGDLTDGYTPLNPSGGSGTTTDPAYRAVRADNPGAFVPNVDLTEVTGENAHDGQDFRYEYTDISGDLTDNWAVINLPNDLTDGHTVRWNFRDPISGQIVNVIDFSTYPGADYTTYTMSFGSTVDIITHIS